MSKIVKIIGHTSSRYAVVNKNNFSHSMILKFHKNSNCSKTSIVKSKIFFWAFKNDNFTNPIRFSVTLDSLLSINKCIETRFFCVSKWPL